MMRSPRLLAGVLGYSSLAALALAFPPAGPIAVALAASGTGAAMLAEVVTHAR